jgi:tripartite-type tricarboxylate transporter receptor subunit TctC
MSSVRLWSVFAILLAAVGAVGAQSSTSWPTKNIRAIVPIGPGSAIDIVARTLFEPLSASLGKPIVVENRSGAGGTIGAATIAKAEPDGYTLMVQSGTLTLAPYLYATLPYDTEKDIFPVAALAILPNVLVIAKTKNINSIADYIVAAKSKAGSMTYASPGVGTSTHVTMERFRADAGFEAVHVPFRGAIEALTEVITGRVDTYFAPLLLALPHIRDGTLVPLAIVLTHRSPTLPNVPTMAEAGYPEANKDVWVGLFVTAGTPTDIIYRLRKETQSVVGSDEYRQKLERLGAESPIMSPEEFRKKVSDDLVENGKILRKMGLAHKG